jgi:hypothetical protein
MNNIDIPIILLDDIHNKIFDFKYFLTKKDIIIWKNCSNLHIKVNSKINKFIFHNCNNLNIIISDAVIGVEFNNCFNINIKIRNNKTINSFELFKSNINLKVSKNDLKKITFFKEKSNLIFNNL